MAVATFHQDLKKNMDTFVHGVYRVTKQFPREELYGVTSQLRRAALSIILNYIEGYARQRDKVHKNFIEIAYASLQESRYLLQFALEENYLDKEEFKKLEDSADGIGKMLWGMLKKL